MSAELRSAAGDGRLRIYPIDLLQAASRRLKLDAQASATTGARPAATTTGAGPAAASATTSAPASGSSTLPADFDRFLGDVTDYLNSTEYLVAFPVTRFAGPVDRDRPRLDLPRASAGRSRCRGRATAASANSSKLDAAARRLLDHHWDETLAKLARMLMRICSEAACVARPVKRRQP
jgi:hypothetical protein